MANHKVHGSDGEEGFGAPVAHNPHQPMLTKNPNKKRYKPNQIKIYHQGHNSPDDKHAKFRPIEIDYSGTTYEIHPSGVRFVKKPVTKKMPGPIGMDGEATVRELKILVWTADKNLPPVPKGGNAVEIPVNAWNDWLKSAAKKKLLCDEAGNQLVVTQVELAEQQNADREAIAIRLAAQRSQEADLKGRLAQLEALEADQVARLQELEAREAALRDRLAKDSAPA